MQLFQYWNRLRAGRPAPKRTEIEPADIRTLLADTFILESDARGEGIFRLAGTRLCATHGRELKGFAFASLWRARDQRVLAKLVYGVFTKASVVVVTYEGASLSNRSAEFELLLLPLHGEEQNRRALGICTAVSSPYWLGSDPIVEASVQSVRVVDADREPMFLKNRPAIGVPTLSPADGEIGQNAMLPRRGRRIRHLVVLPGGRE